MHSVIMLLWVTTVVALALAPDVANDNHDDDVRERDDYVVPVVAYTNDAVWSAGAVYYNSYIAKHHPNHATSQFIIDNRPKGSPPVTWYQEYAMFILPDFINAKTPSG